MHNSKSYLGDNGRFFLEEQTGLINYDMLDYTEHGKILKECANKFIMEIITAPSIYNKIFSVKKIT